eukprot:PLAT8843.1.p1 GENE.PLAT8843.1~~PLAT8843.1.p1  ORF type:complete len:409 (+),score=182.94 PLAT8843.1:61-1287(+)
MAALPSSTFITQPRLQLEEYPPDEIGDLEALVSGVTQSSQSTLLLKKRKEMREVDDALEFMKEEFKTRMEACRERQAEFERQQREMKKHVNRFEKFIQENDMKRHRAEIKYRMEAKQIETNRGIIKKLEEKLEKIKKERGALAMELGHLDKYRVYLDSVVDASSEEYMEITDILMRHKTLEEANRDLKRIVEETDNLMDKLRQKLNTLKRETHDEILVQNSLIHAKQKELEELRSKSYSMEVDREAMDRKALERNREFGQVVMSIKNLYTRCVATMHGRVSDKEEKDMETFAYLSECLRFIQNRTVDLLAIRSGYSDFVAEREALAAEEEADLVLDAPSPGGRSPPRATIGGSHGSRRTGGGGGAAGSSAAVGYSSSRDKMMHSISGSSYLGGSSVMGGSVVGGSSRR